MTLTSFGSVWDTEKHLHKAPDENHCFVCFLAENFPHGAAGQGMPGRSGGPLAPRAQAPLAVPGHTP